MAARELARWLRIVSGNRLVNMMSAPPVVRPLVQVGLFA